MCFIARHYDLAAKIKDSCFYLYHIIQLILILCTPNVNTCCPFLPFPFLPLPFDGADVLVFAPRDGKESVERLGKLFELSAGQLIGCSCCATFVVVESSLLSYQKILQTLHVLELEVLVEPDFSFGWMVTMSILLCWGLGKNWSNGYCL